MTYATLLLIRHAQSENNAKPDSERVPDPSITSLGREQADLLAAQIDRYRLSLIYCSPFRRTLQTLAPIVRTTGLTPIIRQDLFEQGGCHSGFEEGSKIAQRGMTREDLTREYSHWEIDPRIQSNGWNHLDCYETLDMARNRARMVRSWYETHQERHHQNRVAMMIHADFKLRLLESFLEIDDLNPMIGDAANTSISCLIRENGRWRLKFWNQFQHLPESHVTY